MPAATRKRAFAAPGFIGLAVPDFLRRRCAVPIKHSTSRQFDANRGFSGRPARGSEQEEFVMANTPLMPKATAVWLIDSTTLSFDQIAAFCRLHPLEVKAVADGDSAQGIKGLDPVLTGQLTREDIDKGEADPAHRLTLLASRVQVPETKRRAPRYTPVSRRQDRPNAILWLVRNHAELKDAQIIRMVGTTKPTIQAIRDRTHWNSTNLTPIDPVTLGLCTQLELDLEVKKSTKDRPVVEEEEGAHLLRAEETTAAAADTGGAADSDVSQAAVDAMDIDPESVFAKLKNLKSEDL
jgi:hypothetical protein